MNNLYPLYCKHERYTSLLGIFDSEEKAQAHAWELSNETKTPIDSYFYCGVELNQSVDRRLWHFE